MGKASGTERGEDGLRGIGIDGCRGGWAAVEVSAQDRRGSAGDAADDSANGASGALRMTGAVYGSLTALWEALAPRASGDLVLLDMPLGLPEGSAGVNNRYVERACDSACRALLPRARKSSVFTPPARQALAPEVAIPSVLNAQLTGKKLSKQTENLIPKLREADAFIQHVLEGPLAGRLEEAHPELCFQALSGNALVWKKRMPQGATERIAILHAAGCAGGDLARLLALRKAGTVATDDWLDAAVLAVCAYRLNSGIGQKRLVTQKAEYDLAGRVHMNITYCSKGDNANDSSDCMCAH